MAGIIFLQKPRASAPASAAYVFGDRTQADNIAVSGLLAGDMVFVGAIAFSATPPTVPSGDWTVEESAFRATAIALTVASRVVASDGEFTNTGVFANAVRIGVWVYRPTNCTLAVRGTPVKADGGNNTTLTTPALVSPLATSWGLAFSACASSASYSSGVTATVRVGSGANNRVTLGDSNGPCGGTFPAQTITLSANSGGSVAISLELELA